MEPLFQYVQRQYQMVRDSRKAVFNYCKTISTGDFLKENSSFGRGGSMRNLLVHIANAYEFWIGKYGLNKNMIFSEYHSKKNVDEVIELFDQVDALVFEFIASFHDPMKNITYEINGIKNSVEPFKLFTHVFTHEFHHKGQILSVSRQLGYTPVDTDIIR